MTIIPLSVSIHRDPKTGKKTYKSLTTGKWVKSPTPAGWSTTQNDLTAKQVPSYAIRCDDDLVVIDCDDAESTELITNLLSTLPEVESKTYIVSSDKGFKHFYFAPTQYFRESSIYVAKQHALGKIDVQFSSSKLIFTDNIHNHTKSEVQSIADPSNKIGKLLVPIPNIIVDTLAERVKKTITQVDSDYKPLDTYLGPIIEQGLALYLMSGNYRDIQPVIQLVTPSKFRGVVGDDFHPDNIVDDGEAVAYIQALSAKIASDPSISVELHTKLISIITQRLWSYPWTDERLAQALSNLTTQKYNNGRLIWKYDPNATNQPLVSVDGGAYMPIYRTLDDDYIVTLQTGKTLTIAGMAKFRKALESPNWSLLVNGQKINIETSVGLKKLTKNLKTLVRTVKAPYKKTGEFYQEDTLYYNEYVPTKYLAIVRGDYDTEVEGGNHPIITAIIKNAMYANEALYKEDPQAYPGQLSMYDKFLQFLAHKFKTMEQSPVVFHFMGDKGTGKSNVVNILHYFTEAVIPFDFNKSNSQFNKETETAIFLNGDEQPVTNKLREDVKNLSGRGERTIEDKGMTAYQIRNITTYIFTNNKTFPLAEELNDRRFVTCSSFGARRLDKVITNVPDLEMSIKLELESFAVTLRDTALTKLDLYRGAEAWHDEVHKKNFTEAMEDTTEFGQLASFLDNYKRLTGREIHNELTEIFGINYHVIISDRQDIIRLPLYKRGLLRKADNAELTHHLTISVLKERGLSSFIKTDGSKSKYNKAIDCIKLDLSPRQYEEYKTAQEGVEDISGDLGDVELD
jgi:hypothetical protein